MGVKLGINPLTWTNDDLPSLGAETPLDTCLSEGKQAGFVGFELGNKFPRSVDALKPIMASHGLEIVSGWYSCELMTRSLEEEIEAIQDHLKLLVGMGSKVMVLCEVTDCIHGAQGTPVSRRTPMPADAWQSYGEKLTALAEYTLSQGVRIVYHHHMGTLVQTQQEIDLLMEHTGDAVSLLLDTGHLTYAGGDPLQVAEKWAHRIGHVHCKDVRSAVLEESRIQDLSFLDSVLRGVFTVPGDGCIDYPAIFKVLKAADYSGWLVVEAEQDPAIALPLEYATLGYNNLHQMADSAGLL